MSLADFKRRLTAAFRTAIDITDKVIDEMHEDTKFSQPGAAREQHSQGGQQNHDLKTQTS